MHADLARRNKSLPVVAALCSQTAAGGELASLYAGDAPLPAAELERAAALVEGSGARAWCEREAARELALADRHLRAAALDEVAEAELRAVAGLVGARDV